jgi:hypothetical protein
MSILGVILIVVAVVVLLLLLGGARVARKRLERGDLTKNIEAADRALEHARAEDRGWDRSVLEAACQEAIRSHRPDFLCETIALVLVDDRPGVEDDRAHLIASGPGGQARVILGRSAGGDWAVESIE